MRVVVNQLAALARKTGIGHYTTHLLRGLRQLTEDDEIHVFPRGWFLRACRLGIRSRHLLEHEPRNPPSGAQKAPGMLSRMRSSALGCVRDVGRDAAARLFRRACKRQKYDLYHEPNFIPFPSDCPTVTTLHDLSVLLHPEWHPADRVRQFERRFRNGLAQSSHVLAISEFSRQELIHKLNIPADRVTCTYMGVRPGLGPLPPQLTIPLLKQLGLPPQYLLCLGTIEPRKNVLTLLRAYCSLPARLRSNWPLVLAGKWGWNSGDVAEYLYNEARHQNVIYRGYVAESHLAALYNGARALAFPSLYEGFGLPPLEMMACGGAVISSTAGAVVEIVGRQAHLVHPQDIDGWRNALLHAVTDDHWWRSLRDGAETVARPYTWERCAAETLKVYRMLIDDRTQDGAMHPGQEGAGRRDAA